MYAQGLGTLRYGCLVAAHFTAGPLHLSFAHPYMLSCRLQVALKLARLRHDSGSPSAALPVARSAAAYAARARSHRNTERASATPESASFLHASASRSQPTPLATQAMAGLTEADEAVAHLHADVTQVRSGPCLD